MKTNTAPSTTPTPTTCSSSEDDDDVTFVTTGQGNQNKTGVLATLTQDHFDLICNPHGWLDCDIIQQAHSLLHNENLNIEGSSDQLLDLSVTLTLCQVNLYKFFTLAIASGYM